MIELAKILPAIYDSCGGDSQFKVTKSILEFLLHSDDLPVQKEIITALNTILAHSKSYSTIENEIMSLISSLSTEDTAEKINCIFLIEFAMNNTSQDKNKTECFIHIKNLYQDEKAPQMLKVKIANSLKVLTKHLNISQFSEIISKCLEEKNDAIRIPLVETLTSMPFNGNINQYNQIMSGIIKKLGTDESWRVRLTLVQNIHSILALENIDSTVKVITTEVFISLLEDPEPEVKNYCCKQLEHLTKALYKEQNFVKMLSKLKLLESDKEQYVRAALAEHLLKICPFIGSDKTNEYVFPVFLNLIKDDSHEIRMALMKTLDQLQKVCNIDKTIQSIIPSFIEISNNKNWRIRFQACETIPVLAKIVDKKLFMENFMPICLNWLTDSVYSIREYTCRLLVDLYELFKGEDFEKKMLEKLQEMRNSSSYLIRNTVALFVKAFIESNSINEFVEKKLIPIVIKLRKDKTGNIRTNCALIFKAILKKAKSKEISGYLEEYKKDTDYEVLYIVGDN